jgi:ABC-type multidrug transport system fused ATPase/permease subunit
MSPIQDQGLKPESTVPQSAPMRSVLPNAAEQNQSIHELSSSRINPSPECISKKPKEISLVGAAVRCLGLVARQYPRVFAARCALSATEVIYQALPLFLLAPFATAVTSGASGGTVIALGGAIAGCWLLRDWAESSRDYINENFFRKAWRVNENAFLEQHLSRSIETIRSAEYSDKVTKVREQGHRMASFTQRIFDQFGGSISVGSAIAGLWLYSPFASLGMGVVGFLTIRSYLQYAKDFNETEDRVAETRRRYWYRRTHVSTPAAVREIKLLGKEREAIDLVNESDRELAEPRLADTARLMRRNFVSGALSFTVSSSVLYSAAQAAAQGALSSESLIQVLSMTVYASLRMSTVAKSFSDMMQDLVVVREAVNIEHQGEPERIPGKEYQRIPVGHSPVIKFCNVGYVTRGDKPKQILSGLTLTLEPGKVYGLCGESGAGKTTLVRLLMGEISPTEGSILFDDIPVADVDPDDRKRLCRYLAQDYNDFESHEVQHVVRLGLTRGQGEGDALPKAMEDAAIDFVSKDEYEDVIGVDFVRARDFSGGERQRIAYARQIIGRTPLLVLDEPTSKLDHDHEDHIFSRLLARDPEHPRTVIIISHRFANLRAADHIFFMKKARGITEEGTHQELLARGGEYARLARKEEQALSE